MRWLMRNHWDLDDTLPYDQDESNEDGLDDAVDLSALFQQALVNEKHPTLLIFTNVVP